MESSLVFVGWLYGAGFAVVVFGADLTVLFLESIGVNVRWDAAVAGWRTVPMGATPQDAQITHGSLLKVEF